MDIVAFFEWLSGLIEHPIAKVIALLITIISVIVNGLLAGSVRWLVYSNKKRQEELDKKEKKLRRLKQAIEDSEGEIWRTFAPIRPPEYFERISANQPVVITVANLKGGVGKTTLVANLAAQFRLAQNKKKRVLILDLDYQGSLSSMLMSAAGLTALEEHQDVARLFASDAKNETILSASVPLSPRLPDCAFLPAFYPLSLAENRLMVSWLMGDVRDDLRFRLAKLILSDTVKSLFDVVIIDTPPRLTTGTVNALCTSTYLLVPTVMDTMSAQAVISFSRMVKNNIVPLNTSLALLGVVATMTHNVKDIGGWGDNASRLINRELPKIWGPRESSYIFERHVPKNSKFGYAAGEDIAYCTSDEVKHIFDDLGQEIRGRIWSDESEANA